MAKDANDIHREQGIDALRTRADTTPDFPIDKPTKPNGKDATDTASKPRRKRVTGASPLGNVLEDYVALEFARRHTDEFRYVALWNRWMKWDNDRRRPEDTLRAFDEARKLCRDATDAKAKTVAAVVTLARADRDIAATDNQWDTGTKLFNTPTEEPS